MLKFSSLYLISRPYIASYILSLVGICQKHCFQHHSKREDSRNAVSCITPNGKTRETLFPASFQTGRREKHCFYVLSKGSGKENNVTGLFRRESINGNNVVVTKHSILNAETAFPQYLSSKSIKTMSEIATLSLERLNNNRHTQPQRPAQAESDEVSATRHTTG